MHLTAQNILPKDAEIATLIGRAWVPGRVPGPSPVAIRDAAVYDLGRVVATSSQLLNAVDPLALVQDALKGRRARRIGSVEALLDNSHAERRDPSKPYFLTPCDLQALRACGVTFVSSMLERVIEEHAKGDPAKAEEVRRAIGEEIGASIRSVKPGSPEAAKLKASLIRRGLWSQYLEVGIGPDAEVFNKAQPMSAVGVGAEIGIRPDSSWNNPEPEAVLAVNRAGRVVGATLGNDVNLRDFEGRSALLLGKAKDNNASCAIGPFIRLFDSKYAMDDLRATRIEIEVSGTDGYRLQGTSDLKRISRDPLELVAQAINRMHQYPDGLMLFLGTQFAPIQDRHEPGKGFTHRLGDVVTIRAERLGTLVNRVNYCDRIAPWTFGIADLMLNLAQRGLL
ncbi:MAG TPA: fumarylacetoacetate hydrolase family protein [Burkholderiales bacterium]|jgi:fumarylacetoacetate (FAA) hydrolase family protein|nr:fumarylacetoacetate hydrolase family protein [Burkholderiales bacterium]